MSVVAVILMQPASLRALLIHILYNPDFALVLLLAGIFLLYIEFNRPGTIFFAALGMLFAMFALYGLALHPMMPSAVVLSLAAATVVVAGIFLPGPNFLALFGMLLLIQTLPRLITENPRIHLTTAIFVSLIFGTVTNWLGRIALQARRNKRVLNPTLYSAAGAHGGAGQGRLKR